MDIKLTEIVRATTITLKVDDAPMTALPLIKEAFAKLATDLEEVWKPHYAAVDAHFAERDALLGKAARDVMQPVDTGHVIMTVSPEVQEECRQVVQEVKRRGRPPKAQKVEEPVEPTPLEQAIAEADMSGFAVTEDRSTGISPASGAGYAKEDKEPQGEISETPASPAVSTESRSQSPPPETSITDRDINNYMATVCNKNVDPQGYKNKIFEWCKQYVEEGVVPRPGNIKGDEARRAFIQAVEADSGVKYHG